MDTRSVLEPVTSADLLWTGARRREKALELSKSFLSVKYTALSIQNELKCTLQRTNPVVLSTVERIGCNTGEKGV